MSAKMRIFIFLSKYTRAREIYLKINRNLLKIARNLLKSHGTSSDF